MKDKREKHITTVQPYLETQMSIASPSFSSPSSRVRYRVLFKMHFISSIAVTALGLVPSAFGASLYASHFSGSVYSLSYTAGNNGNGSLAITSTASGCGRMPAWLTFDSPSKALYCFDETGSWGGGSVITSYSVNNDGSLRQSGQAKSTGGEVHGSLYGGVNGTSFVAMAE